MTGEAQMNVKFVHQQCTIVKKWRRSRGGVREGWSNGAMEQWSVGRLEDWKVGRLDRRMSRRDLVKVAWQFIAKDGREDGTVS
jgi:hypothetical protein